MIVEDKFTLFFKDARCDYVLEQYIVSFTVCGRMYTCPADKTRRHAWNNAWAMLKNIIVDNAKSNGFECTFDIVRDGVYLLKLHSARYFWATKIGLPENPRFFTYENLSTNPEHRYLWMDSFEKERKESCLDEMLL